MGGRGNFWRGLAQQQWKANGIWRSDQVIGGEIFALNFGWGFDANT
jgi:hypothetical protein